MPRVRRKANAAWREAAFVSGGLWLRGTDSNRRPSGYEPDELPLLHPAMANASRRALIGQTSGTSQAGAGRRNAVRSAWATMRPMSAPADSRARSSAGGSARADGCEPEEAPAL